MANLANVTDATIWASEFIDTVTGKERSQILDPQFLVGWFANAIMSGYDAGRSAEHCEFVENLFPRKNNDNG